MFNRPRLFPVGTSYVQIPVTKTATMRELLELVQRGYRYGTWGLVARDKALSLSQKFAELYRADATRGARDHARGKGHAVARLLMYPDDRTDALLWWLVAASGTGLVHEREALIDTWQARLPWRRVNHHGEWAPQYELEHLQRTRQAGGGRRWTWLMADAYYAELERALVYACITGATEHTPGRARGVRAYRMRNRVPNTLLELGPTRMKPIHVDRLGDDDASVLVHASATGARVEPHPRVGFQQCQQHRPRPSQPFGMTFNDIGNELDGKRTMRQRARSARPPEHGNGRHSTDDGRPVRSLRVVDV